MLLRQGPLPDEPTAELADGARTMVDTFLDSLPRLGVALVVLVVGIVIGRAVRWASCRVLARSQTASFARVMSTLAAWAIMIAFALVASAVAFPSVKPVDLLAGLGLFSVALGFAFQDILENTLSGVLLLFRQPFEGGDQIEVQGQAGTVQAITIRETRMRTFDGQLVVIPNRDVYKSVIRVQTHFPERRLAFIVGIAFENDVRHATRVIVDALSGVDGTSTETKPEALVAELGVSTVNIEARFWCSPAQHETRVLLDEAIKSVKEALDSAGIEMPADIVALQATPSFKAAIQGDAEVTPGGGVLTRSVDTSTRTAPS